MEIKRFIIDVKQQVNPTFMSQVQNAYPQAQTLNLGESSGDLLIQLDNKTLLMEVKSSVNDFVASILDKRLFTQSEGMKAITPWAFLLHPEFKYDSNNRLMGVWGSGYVAHDHWTRKHIDGALRAVVARGVIPQSTYQGVVSAIRDCVLWASEADSGAVTQEPIKLSPFDKDDQQTLNLLCWLDGIGVKQAKSMMYWMKKRNPTANRLTIFNRAFGEFEGDDRPAGWTNNTIRRNREQAGLERLDKPKRTEWLEGLDLEVI